MTKRYPPFMAALIGVTLGLSALAPIAVLAADLAGGPVKSLASPIFDRQQPCGPVRDFITDSSDPLWQHRWCAVQFVFGGIRYEARHDYFHADNGSDYVFKKKADYFDCQDAQDRPKIGPNTRAMQC